MNIDFKLRERNCPESSRYTLALTYFCPCTSITRRSKYFDTVTLTSWSVHGFPVSPIIMLPGYSIVPPHSVTTPGDSRTGWVIATVNFQSPACCNPPLQGSDNPAAAAVSILRGPRLRARLSGNCGTRPGSRRRAGATSFTKRNAIPHARPTVDPARNETVYVNRFPKPIT